LKKILVTNDNLAEVTEHLYKQDYLGLDTETYGLAYHEKMFALQIASESAAFYFNLHNYGDGTYVWDEPDLVDALKPLFSKDTIVWFIHNAKFDCHRIVNAGTFLSGRIHCTQAVERLLYNQYTSYSLDACLRRRGRAKNDKVAEYIKKHKCYTKENVDGKKRAIFHHHYDRVPFNLMFEYGCDDAMDVFNLGVDQIGRLDEIDYKLYMNECKLVWTCMVMERQGVLIDDDYTREAKRYEEGCLEDAKEEATELAGEEYRNGPKWLRSAFDRCDQPYDINPKTGNPIFDKHALEKMQSPIAGVVKEIRTREKYIGTYYSSFIHGSIHDSCIHASIRTSGTDTGRFSYSDPNLQNIPKEEDFEKGSIQVRKCFVPREDYCFVMIDFDQQEFRLMLDYAGEHELIHQIVNEGLCVHQATANMVGIERKAAKTLNFGLLYGMGEETLGKALKLSRPEARDLKELYFSRLPRVQQTIRDIIRTAKMRGYIQTWAGRKLWFDQKIYDTETHKMIDLSYKAPNHLIQGGCGDIARFAMNRLNEVLAPTYSKMLIQVHDEIVFEIHKDELWLVDELKYVMENVYQPRNGMKLTCGVEHSWVSWGKQDVVDGYPRIQI
jgi:DNA polymerase-1